VHYFTFPGGTWIRNFVHGLANNHAMFNLTGVLFGVILISQECEATSMYESYVFHCTAESLQDCLRSKSLACSTETPSTRGDIGLGSVVFFFNSDSNTLIGPFTTGEAEEADLEPGAWNEQMDEKDLSENFRVEWEELHELSNAAEKFPFLTDLKICKLSDFKTQELLNALKDAPLFSLPQSSSDEEE
jgi:hypothetical protein